MRRRVGAGKQLTRNPFHDLPVCVFLELVVNRGERIVEFLLSLAFVDEPLLLEGEHDFRAAAQLKLRQLAPDPAEWGTDRGNDGNRDIAEGETLELGTIGSSQVKGCGRERLGCHKDGIDIQPNLVFEHMRIENDPNINLETLSDHPSKGNTSEAVTLTVCYRSAPDI